MPQTEEDIAWLKSTFHPIPKAALPDDCIEYSIFWLSNFLDQANDSEIRLRLRDVQKHAAELQKQWLKDYIWQRQGFSLQLQKDDGEVCVPSHRKIVDDLTSSTAVSHLRGRTEYGDSIEDEWVIVWLLRELSKKFDDIWVKVTDGDGEFLLIEASGTLPPWLEPDVAENRVWINDGQLKIIKPAGNAKSTKRTAEKLSIVDARQIILNDKKRLMYSSSMEEEAFYRLRNYPSQISSNMHHALITLPRKIAFLLKQKPAYISPAIEAFYLRDPISMKALNSKDHLSNMIFPATDLVTVSIRSPKVAYAQLKSQDFHPPAVFENYLPSKAGNMALPSAQSGVKISSGFEMLLTDPLHQDIPAVREMKLILEDLESGDEKLPTDDEISKWDKREDDEKWLDISFDDLEQELDGRKRKSDSGKKREFGDKAAQENLQRIVKQFEEFLNDDKAGPDGAGMFNEDSDDDLDDLDDDDDDDLADDSDEGTGEDKHASFNEDEFSKMMQEMMGMPPEVMREMMTGKLGSGASQQDNKKGKTDLKQSSRVEELDDTSNEEDQDMETLMKQMETELRDIGALNLDPVLSKTDAMRKAVKGGNEDSDLSEDDNEDNDIDTNLVKNLLESFKAQAGAAGPGGNLMNLIGASMPRDEGDSDGDVGGPSTRKSKK